MFIAIAIAVILTLIVALIASVEREAQANRAELDAILAESAAQADAYISSGAAYRRTSVSPFGAR